MANQVAKVYTVAKSQEGYKEGYSNGHWDNREKYAAQVPGMAWVSAGGYPWCALFVAWVALKAGVADLFPRTASCAFGVDWFKKRGRFSAYPALGSQVFFGAGTGGTHTGIVLSYTKTTITYISGNTNANGSPEGNAVLTKTISRKSPYVYGYGLPAYAEGITTADPALKGKAGYHFATQASAPKPVKPSGSTKVITVKAGQTLGSIAAAAGITLAALLGLNPTYKAHPDTVHVGDHITVPAKPAPAKTPTAKPTKKLNPPTCK
ncbi:CHAP domain-containing protein [Streptomyces argyrophyllae]|uniref:CHAP domain-containing protein n=1 Tax=Streptomyces argyrophylli TaxID=2726118 RepID=A0A6M4PFS9_9ACTN|nr:LysM peptidoglycan-binding domain-containing protein [Streptomyces argyrophyllae]QJS09103.1 CHAP domain-containing protein [Streptomyces argyrophyllae]